MSRLARVVGEQLFVELHALNEQGFQDLAEHQPEFLEGVYFGRLAQGLVAARGLRDLVEKQLIRLGQLTAEALIDEIDELEERKLVFPDHA
jgi:hypothetical protein